MPYTELKKEINVNGKTLTIRKLTQNDIPQLFALCCKIVNNLQDKRLYSPFDKNEREICCNDNYSYFVGVFDKNKLIASSCLYFDIQHTEPLLKRCDLSGNSCEISDSMVLPNYRGFDLMYLMNVELLKIAKDKNITHLLATVHPNNIASLTSLQKLGFTIRTKYLREFEIGTWERYVLAMEL